MPKTTLFATNLFDLFNTNAAYAGIGDAPGLQPSATAGNLYVSLHTADPGVGGNQTSNECNYTGYGRVLVARSGAGWTVAGNQVSNAANIVFGLYTLGTNTVTWFGIGTNASGAGQLLYAFPLIRTYHAFFATVAGNLFYQASGLSANDPIQLLTAPGGSLPGGFAQGTTYFVRTISGDTFTLTTTSGGGADITVTVHGSGLLGKIAALVVSPGVTPEFLAGQLILSEV